MYLRNEFKNNFAFFDLPCGKLVRPFKIDGETQGKKTEGWTEEDKRDKEIQQRREV